MKYFFKDNAFRFVQARPFLYCGKRYFFADDKEDANGDWHAESDGKYVSHGGSGSASAKKNKSQTARVREKEKGGFKRLGEIIAKSLEDLHDPNCTKTPKEILRDTFRSLSGSYRCNVPGMGERGVELGPAMVNHHAKYISHIRPQDQEQHLEIALFGLSKIKDILDTGKWTDHWRDGEQRHPNHEFITVYKRYPFVIRNEVNVPVRLQIMFAFDLQRRKLSKNQTKVEFYNSTNSQNKDFATKQIKQNMFDGEMSIKIAGMSLIISNNKKAHCQGTGIRVA